VQDMRKDQQLWFRSQTKYFRFDIPKIWSEQNNHNDNCYFCSVEIKGFNRRNKIGINYPNIKSAIRPVWPLQNTLRVTTLYKTGTHETVVQIIPKR